MSAKTFRLIWDWEDYEAALLEAAKRRGWTEQQIATALWRDGVATIEVSDIDAHLDWHEQMGLEPPRFLAASEEKPGHG